MPEDGDVRAFVLDYLREVGATVREADGVFTAAFPPGRKRKFGRERHFTFEAERRREHVELVETGSPFLKLLLLDAQTWGSLGTYPAGDLPPGTRVYTFQLDAYSSLKKRTAFVAAVLDPVSTAARLEEGVPRFFHRGLAAPVGAAGDVAQLKAGLPDVLRPTEAYARRFAEAAVGESHGEFSKALDRVQQYFQGVHQETHLKEARIRKRLGEIQSKLYFTEDGLRELRLQQEQERLTQELHALKKQNIRATQSLTEEQQQHAEKIRRRHEPKLRIRLVAATLIVPPLAGAPPAEAVAPPVGDPEPI